MNAKENPIVRYFRESRTELEKVVWPSRRETIRATLIVVGVSLFTALFLGALDYGLNAALQLLIAAK